MKVKAALYVLVLDSVVLAGRSEPKEKVGEVPAVAWGEVVNGLQAGIAFKRVATAPLSGIMLDLHVRNAGDKPAHIQALSIARDYWDWGLAGPLLEVKVGGKIRRYRGPVIEPPPPPTAAAFMDLAPGAMDSTEVVMAPEYWELEEPFKADFAFVFRNHRSEYPVSPASLDSPTKVTGLWTGEVRSGAVEVEIAAKAGAAAR